MTHVRFKILQCVMAVGGLALVSGCAGFPEFQGAGVGPESGSPQGYATQSSDLSNADGIRTAVQDAQRFLQEQDGKVRDLLEMRADFEEQIHTIQETEIGRLNSENKIVESRVAALASQMVRTRDEIDKQWAPVQALAETQADELTNLKDSMLAIVEQTQHDRELLRNNLANYRDALVEFHALMVKLETMVLDEEYRAQEAEADLKKTIKGHDRTLTKLESKSTALGHMQKRMTQLHHYVNEVQKDLRHAVATWQAESSGRDEAKLTTGDGEREIFATPSSLGIKDIPQRPRPAVVPKVDHVIRPLETPSTIGSKEKPSVTSTVTTGESAILK